MKKIATKAPRHKKTQKGNFFYNKISWCTFVSSCLGGKKKEGI